MWLSSVLSTASRNQEPVPVFDAIIIGGGPAGCATALAFSKFNEGASFINLDDSDPSLFKIGESLPPESTRLLQYLDITLSHRISDAVASGAHMICTGNTSAWASPELEERHAIFNPFGHGLHLDRVVFDQTLRQTVIDRCQDKTASSQDALVSCLMKGRFKTAEKDSAGNWAVHVDVADQVSTFVSKWVIDATGRKASFATKQGAKVIITDQLLAFYAVFTGPSPSETPDADKDHRTMIEATPDGWFYSSLLPLKNGLSTRVVAFHTLPTHPTAKLARRRDGFLQILHASSSYISTIIKERDYEMVSGGGFPRSTVASSSHLDRACDLDSRWIAVGDAAMAFDPLSSQGMITALEMGCRVGKILADLVDNQHQGVEVNTSVEEMYKPVREQYEQHRKYYYQSVGRFDGEEFWSNVTVTRPGA